MSTNGWLLGAQRLDRTETARARRWDAACEEHDSGHEGGCRRENPRRSGLDLEEKVQVRPSTLSRSGPPIGQRAVSPWRSPSAARPSAEPHYGR